jgi:hypothetical protein
MKIQEIQKMAKSMGVDPYKKKKADIIRGIQKQENNIDCYGTERMDYCGEDKCLWRRDCLSENNNARRN